MKQHSPFRGFVIFSFKLLSFYLMIGASYLFYGRCIVGKRYRNNETPIEFLFLFWKASMVVAAVLWIATLVVFVDVLTGIDAKQKALTYMPKWFAYASYCWVLLPAMFAAVFTYAGITGWLRQKRFTSW